MTLTFTKEQLRIKKEFDALEQDFIGIAQDRDKLKALWERMNTSGGSTISLVRIWRS